nr:hypothetical protein [Tanacetum cinerariifolium]
MVDEDIENLVEGTENKNVDDFFDNIFDNQEEPRNRIDPESYKESSKAEKDTNMVIISNDDVKEESIGDEFKLRRRENGKGIEETKDTPPPITTRSLMTRVSPLSTDKETLQGLTIITQDAPSSSDKEKL